MPMNSTVKNIVHNASLLVFVEAIWRIVINSKSYWVDQGICFAAFLLVCIVMQAANFKDCTAVKHPYFRTVLSFIHGADGLLAGAIGLSIYYRSRIGLIVSLAFMCKFGLLCLLNRMILAKAVSASPFETMMQTMKSFLHHVASFIFVSAPTEILITAAWRTLSMTGHALLVLRGHVDPNVIRSINWVLSYLRIIFVTALIVALCLSSDLRASFGHSAVGHIAYLTIRLVPLLQVGAVYIPEAEREEWALLDDGSKIRQLLQGRHPWLAVEVGQLFLLTMILAVSRLVILHGEVMQVMEVLQWQSSSWIKLVDGLSR